MEVSRVVARRRAALHGDLCCGRTAGIAAASAASLILSFGLPLTTPRWPMLGDEAANP